MSANSERKPSSWKRRWAIRVSVYSVLFSAAFLGTELYFRSVTERLVNEERESWLGLFKFATVGQITEHTKRGKRLIPGSRITLLNNRLSHRDIPIHINQHGFRDDEIAVDKASDEWRVLALGDSITMGDYLPAEEVWVERAEVRLQAAMPDRRVEVINAGLGDMGLSDELNLLEDRGLAAEPDLVLLAFYINDSRPPWGFPGELGSPGWFRRRSVVLDATYRALLLRDWIREQGEERFGWGLAANGMNWHGDPETFRALATLARYDWGSGWEPEFRGLIDVQLGRLARLAEANRFRVALVLFPAVYQVEAATADDQPQQIVTALAGSRGFPVLDLLPTLRASGGEDVFFDHCHPREAANALIGTTVAEFLFSLEPRQRAVVD